MRNDEQFWEPSVPEDARRPLKLRSSGWARSLAASLGRMGVTSNHLAIASIVVSAAGAYVLLASPTAVALIVCALCVQLRLLCNLLEGMEPGEGGTKSAHGPLYSELPDRIADAVFIVALGYAAGNPVLGWYAALAAMLTAHIRVLGGALGFAQDFRGPFAMPQRMAAMTAGLLLATLEMLWLGSARTLRYTILVIAVGATATCVTRTAAIAARLKDRG